VHLPCSPSIEFSNLLYPHSTPIFPLKSQLTYFNPSLPNSAAVLLNLIQPPPPFFFNKTSKLSLSSRQDYDIKPLIYAVRFPNDVEKMQWQSLFLLILYGNCSFSRSLEKRKDFKWKPRALLVILVEIFFS
jgi:hypothetical protein